MRSQSLSPVVFDFADSLTSALLAFKESAPILLTKPNELPSAVKRELNRLKPEQIIIIGGINAVSQQIENDLHTYANPLTRIAGNDRYETAIEIADRLNINQQMILVSGERFADALAISPYAAKNQIPILLTKKEKMPDVTKTVAKNYNKTTIIGGEQVIHNSQLVNVNNPIRVSGKDRIETSVQIAETFFKSSPHVFVSSATQFPDALTGSSLAAKNKAPILLVENNVGFLI